ncbi:MAG TPA: hypothetical protein VHZ05_03460 [Acidimicrobiales bacterium]|jgi:hypothetical protein|nr:hypothetical protein [Acidimicrobiales bacterium]
MTAGYEDLLRWYPVQWRERYGDEMAALLEDTYATAGEVPLRQRARLAWSGLGERARSAGIVGWSQDADVRLRGGWLLVLCGWAFYVVAGAIFVKSADHWATQSPPAGHWVATGGFNVVGVTAVVGCLVVLLAAIVVVPAFVRFVRSGGWHEVSRPFVVALVCFATSAMLFAVLVAWAHSLSAHDPTGGLLNGGLPIYGWFFILVSLVFFAAVGSATAAAIAVARRVELSRRSAWFLGVMAIALVGVMALTLVSLVAWWTSEAVHAPGFLAQVIGNGVPYQSSVAPPTLLAAGILMVIGLALGLAGLVRIVGSLGAGGRALA